MNDAALISAFRGCRVTVLGDLMLDCYRFGRVERISPEAPVPVLRASGAERRPGGAANVAVLLAALGAAVRLVGVCGEDQAGGVLLSLLEQAGIDCRRVVRIAGRPTTTKTRFLADRQQLLRVDEEADGPLPETVCNGLHEALDPVLEDCEVLLLSDYQKGVLEPELIVSAIAGGKRSGAMIAADPKTRHFAAYRGVTLFTPNQREAAEGIGIPIHDEASLLAAGREIVARLAPEVLLITRGEAGMALFHQGVEGLTIPTVAREVADVTGAGDVVVATAALALARGASPEDAARLANLAAGLEVEHLGCRPIGPDELAGALR
jgi:D-beta-D-heptose 7-phosphate kinase/D-beta-D-heptose 1-phosphate adenosyltransferase